MLLLDNSAWAQLNSGRLPEPRRDEVMSWMHQRQVGVCLPFLLEMGHSARSGAGHRTLMSDMARLQRVQMSHEVEKHALQAQHELAAAGHHRLPPIDVMIAACAHDAGAGVLHYDADYDLIAKHTTLEFESVWLAPRGSLAG